MRRISKISRKKDNQRLYFDKIVQLWFNYHFLFFRSLIFRGLKLRAFNYFCKIKYFIKQLEFYDPSFVFLLCMLSITPSLFLRSANSFGSSNQIPFPLDYWKKISFGCRWVIKLLKDTNRVITVKSVVDLLVSSLYNKGLAIKKKQEVYKIAALNSYLLKTKGRVFKR